MIDNILITQYAQHPVVKDAIQAIRHNCFPMQLKGLHESSPVVVIGSIINELIGIHVIIINDRDDAAYFHNDLQYLLSNNQVCYFPSSYKRITQNSPIDKPSQVLRTDVFTKLQSEKTLIIVTFPEAIAEKVVSSDEVNDKLLRISVSDKLNLSFICEVLEEYGFKRVDFVNEPGQFAIRGGIVDIFSFSDEYPSRIIFFDDEIESIRSFNPENQLSIAALSSIIVLPDLITEVSDNTKLVSFDQIIPKNSIIWFEDIQFSKDKIEKQSNLFGESDFSEANRLVSSELITTICTKYNYAEFGVTASINTFSKSFLFNTSPQPGFRKNFELLFTFLDNAEENSYKTVIISNNQKQIARLNAIFHDNKRETEYESLLGVLNKGFTDHDLHLNILTDHQIFERYHKYHLRGENIRNNAGNLAIKEIMQLNPGDYIVHIDHGIGRFDGLFRTDISGKPQEVIKLVFQNNDVLMVSIHSLHRISKFRGKDGEIPRISKLGSGAWQNLKNKAKKQVKDIARELITLYAERMDEVGYAYSPDSYLQTELEASFIYEDTPDQEKATISVKLDMEKDVPMDRLICGDVGFGKTEIAVRAAFKAATDNKQVAILVPTTILAYQHYNTFKERLKDFPVKIDYVSRFRKPAEIKEILQKTKEGHVDILIGTHRLVSKDVVFKDLGLLIIDEEQRFGVSIKEKLKQIKINVDTLTLTATPIPRTLQFSLMGARDLSIINTPPPNRYPIQTELQPFSEQAIREAIISEIDRGGQVFFINNRIQNIYELEKLLHRIVPEANVVIGHGQMDGNQLEKVIMGFAACEFDVLLATTIIESGLDIPNANTIIINDAHHFGLSELHQLRGRVGRSNKKAFCYLLTPPLSTLPDESRRRLQAIESFSDLGSGFHIALQDLDIRGAGNLLGAEQSGFIADIGLETYKQILSEAMLELRDTEFKELFDNRDTDIFKKSLVADCMIDSDLELLFPVNYISNIAERIKLYRDLDNLSNENEMVKFEEELRDRFGEPPTASKELLNVVRLRWIAQSIGIERIILKNSKMICYFVSDAQSPFYASPIFTSILSFIKTHPNHCKIKEATGKLSIVFEKINSIKKAIDQLEPMAKYAIQ